jgi:hypothetical protein
MPLNERLLREQLRGRRDIQSRNIRGGYVCMHGSTRLHLKLHAIQAAADMDPEMLTSEHIRYCPPEAEDF